MGGIIILLIFVSAKTLTFLTLPERFAFLDSAPEEQRQAALSHLAVMVVRAIRLEIERIKMNNETIRVATVDFV